MLRTIVFLVLNAESQRTQRYYKQVVPNGTLSNYFGATTQAGIGEVRPRRAETTKLEARENSRIVDNTLWSATPLTSAGRSSRLPCCPLLFVLVDRIFLIEDGSLREDTLQESGVRG